MVLLAREFSLRPREPTFTVKYAREVVPELASYAEFEAMMDEIESILGAEPFHPPGHRSETIEGAPPLRRYRPHAKNDARVFYAVQGREVWILAVHPRRSA